MRGVIDVQLARTFLEIVSTGNFQAAAERLYVTQSAVSLRVKRMEAELGQTLFLRSKAGAQLTPAGEQFARFARSMLRVWEEAKHQVAVPEGFDATLLVAAQYSLWPDLGLRWLRIMERLMPAVAFSGRCRSGRPAAAVARRWAVRRGAALRAAAQARPQCRADLRGSARAGLARPGLCRRRGPALRVHGLEPGVPDRAQDAVSRPRDAAASRWRWAARRSTSWWRRVAAGYFPARSVADAVEAGTLHVDADAPAFPFPAYAVSQADAADPGTVAEALRLLRAVADKVDDVQTEVLDESGVDSFDVTMAAEVGVPDAQ